MGATMLHNLYGIYYSTNCRTPQRISREKIELFIQFIFIKLDIIFVDNKQS